MGFELVDRGRPTPLLASDLAFRTAHFWGHRKISGSTDLGHQARVPAMWPARYRIPPG